MLNRLRGLFKQPQTASEPRGVRVAFTRGDELVFDSPFTRSGASIDSAILRAFGGQAAIDPVTLSNAVAVSAVVFACLEYRANAISQLPLYVALSTGDRIEAAGSPFEFFLRGSALTLGAVSRSLDIWGYTYLRKRRNAKRYPTGLEWLNPVNVQEVGQPQITHYQVFDEDTWRYENVPVEDIIVARRFDSRQLGTGISLIEASYRLIGLDFGAVTHALSFLTNSARIDGMLTFEQEVTPDQMKDAKEQWQKFKGAANAHKTAVMPAGARWTPIQATPKDLMLSDTSKDVRSGLSAIWNVDLGLLGLEGVADPLSANSTYSGKQVAFIRNVALSVANSIILPALNEQWANVDFGTAYEIKTDDAKIPALAESHLVKTQTANDARSSGLITHDEARGLLGMESEGDYLKRAPDEPLKLWQGGAITLNLLHHYTLGRAPLVESGLTENGEVVNLNGVIIPVRRIAELANANVDRMKNPIPFSPFGAPTPVSVTTPTAPQLSDGQRDTGDPLFVGLDLGGNVDLIGLQRQLRERYPNVTWNDPADFHITLLFAPVCDPALARVFADALRLIDLPELTLRIGSLKSFDSIGEHALHFRIRENADLRDFQETVYQLAADCGIQPSSYSLPNQWTPHITMGYAAEKTTAYWSSKLAVTPRGLICEHAEQPLIAAMPQLPASVDEQANTAALTRAAGTLDLIMRFPDHAFVKAARRELSAFFAERGYANPTWTPETAWRLDLLSFDSWQPQQVARFLQAADLASVRPLDLSSAGYAERDGVVYLALQSSEALDTLRTSLALQMEDAGMTPILPTLDGIALCEFASSERVDLAGAPVAVYPLVGANVSALKNGANTVQMWILRGMSRAQETDLDRWERVTRRKGRSAPFVSDHVPPLVAAFVTLSLEDEEADAGEVFETARGMLGESARRSFEDTRRSFVTALTGLFKLAANEDVTRGKFAAQLRSQLRVHGLRAFRDGMNSEQYDPESFSAKELAAFRKWQADASERVTAVGVEIFKGGGITEGEAALRADMWANVTLRSIFYKGAALAAADKLKMWNVTPGKDSCKTCLGRNGIVLPYSKWKEIGLPGDYDALECRGMFCECYLTDAAAGARSADFEAIRSLIVHQHEHAESEICEVDHAH